MLDTWFDVEQLRLKVDAERKERALAWLKLNGRVDVSDLAEMLGIDVSNARRILMDICVKNNHVVTYDTCLFSYYEKPPIDVKKAIVAYFKSPENQGQFKTENQIAAGVGMRLDIVRRYIYNMVGDKNAMLNVQIVYSLKE